MRLVFAVATTALYSLLIVVSGYAANFKGAEMTYVPNAPSVGLHSPPDFQRLRALAETGNSQAEFDVAFYYLYGDNAVQQNVGEAINWYRRAAEGGFLKAQYNLGLIYLVGDQVPKDPAQALKWFQRAADADDAASQFKLGLIYATGRDGPKDLVQAYKWWNIAAAGSNEVFSENAISNRQQLEPLMTHEEIVEAQRLSRQWLEQHPKR